jgi:hypothetical protein
LSAIQVRCIQGMAATVLASITMLKLIGHVANKHHPSNASLHLRSMSCKTVSAILSS